LPELSSQSFFGLLDEVYASGRTCYGLQEVAYSGHAGHGPVVHFTFIAQAVRDAAGTVTGLLLFAYDVSAHVLARQWVETHEEQAARTRQQLAQANEQLSVTNEELDVTNEELTVSNHELSVTNLELALANQRLAQANEQLRATNEGMRRQAAELRRAEAAVRQLNDELVLTNEGLVDTVSNAVGEAEAARQEAETLNQQLTAVNDQLGDRNQHLTFTNSELDTFVYTASHDLQSPITNLEGLLEALREELPGDCQAGPAARILALMQESVTRFQRTLGHLAAIARQPPLLGAPPVPVGLTAVVQDVLRDQELRGHGRAAPA
jgi:signal transduction histidine kinase